jgi:hypothetical protein
MTSSACHGDREPIRRPTPRLDSDPSIPRLTTSPNVRSTHGRSRIVTRTDFITLGMIPVSRRDRSSWTNLYVMTFRAIWLASCVLVLSLLGPPPAAGAAAEVKVDREFLAGIIEKLPPFPFDKADRYHGDAKNFRLEEIDGRHREFRVMCQLEGEYNERAALANLAILPSKPSSPGPRANSSTARWKDFRFDVHIAINIEPGAEGMPRFKIRVDEVKRREFDGLAGVISKVMGRFFDDLVTKIAAKKIASMNDKLNAQILKKVATFQNYGVFCAIDYLGTYVVLHFDLTRLKSEGIAGYVYPSPQPGTVPLYRWVHSVKGNHFYTTNPYEPADRRAFRSEGIAGYVLDRPASQAVAFYRWHSRREHFYIASAETSWARGSDYRPEGITCYVLLVPQPGTVPFYRFIDPRTGLHFYTTHPHAEFAK